MQIFHLYGYQYIIHLRKKYSWKSFRSKAKVAPGTYSETFAKRLYASVFDNSVDIKQEYLKYYKDEYENINQFMFWRHGVSEEIYEQMPNAEDGYLAIIKPEWQIEDDELLKETFISFFKELDK